MRKGPFRFGRYTVLEQVGRGAMGVVFAAYDDALGRKIALKLVRTSEHDARHGQRLLREAQALARLSHPNVVGVHEVGEVDGALFIAMEFVHGTTLRAWSKTSRPWTEVLRVFRQAGEGLAAAHAQGLVHRDFKPDNVMIGDDGRVRVMDFGLARSDTAIDPDDRLLGTGPSRLESVSLTATGAVLGTPAYMAPEQLRGDVLDARADQFAYCIALFEALGGSRPFAADTWPELLGAIDRGPTELGDAIPRWLQRAVRRGLQVDPDQRFPDMQALLAALARDPAARSRRGLVLASVGVLAIGTAGVAVKWSLDRTAQCAGGADRVAEVWNDATADRVRAAFEATALAFAPAAATEATAGLDAYAEDWARAHGELCRATRISAERSDLALDRSMSCLERGRVQLAALVELLEHPDTGVVERSALAVASLPRIARCGDLDALLAEVPPPEDPQTAAAVVELERDLGAALVQRDLGQFPQAIPVVEALRVRARAIGHGPALARVELLLAELFDRTGAYPSSAATAEDALVTATASHDDELAARALTVLVWATGERLADLATGRRWARQSGAYLQRLGGPDEIVAAHHRSLGGLELAAGNPDLALDHFERALAARERLAGPDSALLVIPKMLVGNAQNGLGRFAEARAAYEGALALSMRRYGPAHPTTSILQNNLGAVLDRLGERAAARQQYSAAIAGMEASFGPNHPDLAAPLDAQGGLAHEDGDDAGALALHQRSLRITEANGGPDSPELVYALNNLGLVQRALGRLDDAAASYTRALAIVEKAFGPDHPHLISPTGNLALVRMAQGRDSEAETLLRRQVAMIEHDPAQPTSLATPLVNLATLARRRGADDEAEASFLRAYDVVTRTAPANHPDLCEPALGLAEVADAREKPDDAERWARRALAVCPVRPDGDGSHQAAQHLLERQLARGDENDGAPR
jgi:tetratricopeptide (TPR) repeat protein/tRNA A-37 threonylcarbamoyl transferase component Bud32